MNNVRNACRRVLVSLLLFTNVFAEAAEMTGMRTWAAPDNTRIVFDLTDKVDFKVFRMPDHRRIVLDLSKVRLKEPLSFLAGKDRIVSSIRSASRATNELRIVLDLQHPVEMKSFAIPPSRQYGHRLVVDLIDKDFELHAIAKRPERVLPPTDVHGRDVLIAVDAGHGGEDPGAESPSGTREKDVVLAIARKLATLIDASRGMHATLIRDGDYYVGLRDRIKRARDRRADLFVSIHADAFQNARASGSSVYVLSRRGASSESARWVATRENEADSIGGVSLEDKDDMVKAALRDISQVGVMDASAKAARKVLRSLTKINNTHHEEVQRAGFVVLKSSDIPSMLVETAFLTNHTDERRLRDSGFQQAIAVAIFNGIREYLIDGAPPGTLFALQKERFGSSNLGRTAVQVLN